MIKAEYIFGLIGDKNLVYKKKYRDDIVYNVLFDDYR
jgi:hypothetical protein